MSQHFDGYGYLAAEGYAEDLLTELSRDFPAEQLIRYGDLILRPGERVSAYWARTVIEHPCYFHIDSIGDGVRILKGMQRNWALYPFACYRRSALISEKLPFINLKPKEFLTSLEKPLPQTPMGLWTLLDEQTMLAAPVTSSPLPLGELLLVEDHENPPSRAYLKLQEALLRCGQLPQKGSRCLDAGASPGGWTWVLRQLGAEVTAIDRAELSPQLMADPMVHFIKHDAFTLQPEELGQFDWVCSDVISYPPRLLEWVHKWLDSGLCRNMICTIKMQGEPDWETIERFAAIPGGKVLHLRYNKHELTWIYVV
ncbi:MAG: SAM-dependent methyltransferase [Spirochaetaceae bacterium]|jgi:23S rRNA (cytidine2498-2'-O)-methyltransferase|nr:SAM-dependent methyltransferase [Spirochaetaceae bacterium]